jgi:hypothetical protein
MIVESWSMPEAALGDIVYYYAHEGADPVMAFVTKVGRETLVLWALAPGYGGNEKPSVHHKDDPRLGDFPDWKPYGTWAHKPKDSRLASLSERLSLLEKKAK